MPTTNVSTGQVPVRRYFALDLRTFVPVVVVVIIVVGAATAVFRLDANAVAVESDVDPDLTDTSGIRWAHC